MSFCSCGLGHDTLKRALYSPKEVRQILGVSHATVYRLLAAARLDGRKLGNKTTITAESVERLVAELPKIGE
jgi:excisionase family DNA binding protein